MFIRGLLILSLIAQLACSYQCCGITILCECLFWPRPCSGSECGASEGCNPLKSDCCVTAIECDAPAENCCVQTTACCESESIELQCADAAFVADANLQGFDDCSNDRNPPASPHCTPIDPKARRPQDIERSPIDLAALAPVVAHPLVPTALVDSIARGQESWDFYPLFRSNHQRQASLEIWLN